MPMLDISTKIPAKPVASPATPLVPAKSPANSVSGKGTIVLLSPDALKLSRDLHAIENDPEIDAMQRHDASVQLRKMAAEILTGKKG
jgi:hypothetical protein